MTGGVGPRPSQSADAWRRVRSRPLRWLLATALAASEAEDDGLYVACLGACWGRATPHTLRSAERLCHSDVSAERVLGIDILAQLGHTSAAPEGPFEARRRHVILGLLEHDDAPTVAAAAVALSHLHAPGAVPKLVELAAHADADVRRAVAIALGCYCFTGEDDDPPLVQPIVFQTLAALSRDGDRDVRDWASFALARKAGSLQPDNAEELAVLRQVAAALWACADDHDYEVRHQALAGLARLGEPGVSSRLEGEIEAATAGADWCVDIVEGAEALADPALAPALTRLLESGEWPDHFATYIRDALAACTAAPDTGCSAS